MKSYDVVAMGELLIDFTENGRSEQGNALFEANPGGAPCNVLAMLLKLDKSCAFVGKVGDDMFGRQLRDVVREAGIDTDGLLFDRDVRTTLAFVQTLPGDSYVTEFNGDAANVISNGYTLYVNGAALSGTR